ncbi:MAG: hypothetical protein ACK5O2_05975 [Microthrixaceae bacterium]
MDGSLFVEFLDESYEVEEGEAFTFGRDARLVVDSENLHLHRVLGTFMQHNDMWVLHNVGRHLTMVVSDSQSRTELAPGGFLPLLSEEFTVSFSAGPARYELSGRLPGVEIPAGVDTFVTDTLERTTPDLNSEQRMLVACLAEPLLAGDADWPTSIPSNAEVADRLGWTRYKLNRKLDYLCSKVNRHGVDGVAGNADRRATQRRVRLVEYLVGCRVITSEDLGELPRSPAERVSR